MTCYTLLRRAEMTIFLHLKTKSEYSTYCFPYFMRMSGTIFWNIETSETTDASIWIDQRGPTKNNMMHYRIHEGASGAPPLAADLWFVYAQTLNFLNFILQPSTLSMICYSPPPVDKVHAPVTGENKFSVFRLSGYVILLHVRH